MNGVNDDAYGQGKSARISIKQPHPNPSSSSTKQQRAAAAAASTHAPRDAPAGLPQLPLRLLPPGPVAAPTPDPRALPPLASPSPAAVVEHSQQRLASHSLLLMLADRGPAAPYHAR